MWGTLCWPGQPRAAVPTQEEARAAAPQKVIGFPSAISKLWFSGRLGRDCRISLAAVPYSHIRVQTSASISLVP